MDRTTNVRRHDGATGQGNDALFGKLVAFGYNDGPTTGVVQSIDGTTDYCFDLIAIDVDGLHDHDAWDRREDVRAFSLMELPPGSFERIVSTLSPVEEPTWPTWVPGVRRSSPIIDELIAREVIPILQAPKGQRYVLVAPDLLGPPLAILPKEDSNGEPAEGWLSRPAWETVATAT